MNPDILTHVALLLGLVAVSAVTARHLRRRGVARGAAVTVPSQEPLATDPGAVPPCVVCGEPSWFQMPHLVERRGLLDTPFFDGLWRRLGVRREVQLTVVLERPIHVPTNVCPACHRIARARCEQYVCEMQGRRANAAVEEATAVADFLAFGLLDHARVAVTEKVRRLRRQQATVTVQARPSLGDGSGGGA